MKQSSFAENTGSWYLIQTKPNSFKIAERNLARQNFVVFNPMLQQTRRRGGQFTTILRPLFPSYMFVNFDAKSAPWHAINNTQGVTRLIVQGNTTPKPVPAPLITALQQRCNKTGQFQSSSDLQPGDKVRLTSGPFSDFLAKVEIITPDQRVWVLLDILGRGTKVKVTAGELLRV